MYVLSDDVNVTIDGPARTEVKRENAGDRATFSYLPMTPGAYNINISYKGKTIKGSPFQAKVSGKSPQIPDCAGALRYLLKRSSVFH